MVQTKRDQSVGKAWLAYHALRGDEPLECVAEYLEYANVELGRLSMRAHAKDSLTREDEEFLAGHHMVLIALILSLKDQEGGFKIEFKRRRTGPPVDFDRIRLENRAASIAMRLIDEGVKVEAAVAHARQETGISRAVVFRVMKFRRAQLKRLAEARLPKSPDL